MAASSQNLLGQWLDSSSLNSNVTRFACSANMDPGAVNGFPLPTAGCSAPLGQGAGGRGRRKGAWLPGPETACSTGSCTAQATSCSPHTAGPQVSQLPALPKERISGQFYPYGTMETSLSPAEPQLCPPPPPPSRPQLALLPATLTCMLSNSLPTSQSRVTLILRFC